MKRAFALFTITAFLPTNSPTTVWTVPEIQVRLWPKFSVAALLHPLETPLIWWLRNLCPEREWSRGRSIVRLRTVSFALSLALLAGAALSLAAQKKSVPGAATEPLVLAQDKGKLTIKLGSQTVGHEEFEIVPSGGGWLAKGTA